MATVGSETMLLLWLGGAKHKVKFKSRVNNKRGQWTHPGLTKAALPSAAGRMHAELPGGPRTPIRPHILCAL